MPNSQKINDSDNGESRSVQRTTVLVILDHQQAWMYVSTCGNIEDDGISPWREPKTEDELDILCGRETCGFQYIFQ